MVDAVENSSLNSPRSVVNFGVIGGGWVARDYGIPAICEAENVALVAVCDTNAANLNQIKSVDEIKRTTDLNEFLQTENLDAVYIATPNDSHRFLTERCAAAGKHVLCEKPMAVEYADAAAMVAACEKHGVSYATAFDQRFQARHLKLKNLIETGALGAISVVRIHYACWLAADWCAGNWRVDESIAGGGAFIDLAPHGVDLAQFLIGEPLTDFACFFQSKIHDYAVDDGAAAIGKFAGGTLFSLNVAYNCPDEYPRRTLEIIGTERMATATNTMGQTAGGELVLIDKTGKKEIVEIAETEEVSPFRRQIEAFADGILKNQPFPFTPAQDLATMRIICDSNERRRAASAGK
ncbi:MAG: Gfo/Idh/MocA family oxidoreductase [Acidobacteriota bacterium]|nr:Gfo/Idh/MocA family oxidoreductase [Acidobacteriota bacterium]